MEIKYRICETDDLQDLIKIARMTYTETFESVNTAENLHAYLNTAFHPEKLMEEINHPEGTFYLVFVDDQQAGYFKVNTGGAQTDVHDENAIELERIYILQQFQRTGLGKKILDRAMNIGREQGKYYMWLGVWEDNRAAINFYKKHGFIKFGEHPFVMGDDHQTDHLMKRDL